MATHGAKRADLRCRRSPKYEAIFDLKTSKALGLTVPPGFR